MFPVASVTKVFTALAVLVATEEEIVDLDEPAGPDGSTVRLLLCHASGLPFDGTLPIAAPGVRRIYGNTAFEVLGELVAERSGMEFATYLSEAVLRPLDMHHTELRGSAAHGAHSTVSDLLRLAGELLEPTRILARDTLIEATSVQLPGLPGVLPGFGPQADNAWGLGMELHDHKAPHWMPDEASSLTFGHFGQSGSFVWIDPVAGVACAALSDQPFGEWAIRAWPTLGRAVLARYASRPPLSDTVT